MGYMGPYSLGRRCLAEFIAMTMTIFFGESILANELLPSTKGHGMGWGFATLGFAFAFYASIQMFDSISAHINPAMCLALWITGDMGAADFFAVSLAELAGAMLGAFLVWLHFLPHFKTIPEPAPTDKEDDLIRRRDYLHTNAMQIASYQTAETRTVDRKDVNPIKDVMYYTYHRNSIKAERAQEFLDRYFHKHTKRPEGVLQRRSVQVADLLEQIKLDRLERKLEQQGSFHKEDISEDDADQHPDMDRPHAVEITEGPIRRTASASGVGVHAERKSAGSAEVRVMPPARSAMSLPPASGRASFLDQAQRLIKRMKGKHVSFNPAVEEKEVSRIDQLYKAAVIADQNAKLSIFATRPAIFSPPLNFLVEVMGTVAIILGALLIKRQKYQLPEPYREVLAVGLIPLQLGFFIWMLIVGLGGPTGYAVNPARDLGPRLAHFLLPIAGKGSSEWRYAWIPFFAPFVGGAIAAVLFKAIDHLYLWE